MPDLSSAGQYMTTTTTASSATSTATTIVPYSYATSKIVKTAVAAGVIVLVLAALVLFSKISSWIRYHQQLRRTSAMTGLLRSEQRATAYEIAAWSDEPGMAPVRGGGMGSSEKKSNSRREKREEMRAAKRGGANAHAVQEWEGVAA